MSWSSTTRSSSRVSSAQKLPTQLHLLNVIEQALPGGCRFEYRTTDQNRLPQPDFKCPNALGNGRLAQPKRQTGTLEPPALNNRRQRFQQFVVNHKEN